MKFTKTLRLRPWLTALLIFAGLGVTAGAAPVGQLPSLLANKRVLWLGASITQEGEYVTFVEYYLDRLYPSEKFDIVSIGLASETVSGLTEKQHPFPRPDLFNRLTNALDFVKPQVVFAIYGVNDGIYHPQSPERTQAFHDGILHLADNVRAANAQLILLTPLPFDPLPVKSARPANAPDFAYFAPYVGYDEVITSYAQWELGLDLPDVFTIDLHTPVADYLKERRETEPRFSFGTDGIHPNTVGHLLMARTILKALGAPMNTNGLDAELARIQADPLFALVARHRQIRSDGWLPYVGYTRGTTVKTDSIEATEKAAAEVQAQIDQMRRAVRVACVGDSITFGAGVKDRDHNSYPVQLGRLLGAGYDVRNFGFNGATMLSQGDVPYVKQKVHQEAVDFAPDIVVIMLGTNDSKHPGDGSLGADNAVNNWQFKAEFVPDYEALIAEFRKANPAVKVYVCLPTPDFPGRWGINDQTIRNEVIPLVRQVAGDEHADIIDLNAAFAGKADLFPDTVHPNNAGTKLMAMDIYQSLTGKAAPANTP